MHNYEITYTKADLIDLYKFRDTRYPLNKWMPCLVALIVTYFGMTAAKSANFFFIAALFAVPYILMQLFLVYSPSILGPKFFRNLLDEKLNISLTNKGMYLKSDSFDAELSWQHFGPYYETKRLFILTEGLVWRIIPKHIFESKEELAEFRNLLQEKLSTKQI
jgi:hypothetical protein